MRDEEAARLLTEKGAQCDKLRRMVRRHRERLSTKAREIVNRQARRIQLLEAELVSYRKEDE